MGLLMAVVVVAGDVSDNAGGIAAVDLAEGKSQQILEAVWLFCAGVVVVVFGV